MRLRLAMTCLVTAACLMASGCAGDSAGGPVSAKPTLAATEPAATIAVPVSTPPLPATATPVDPARLPIIDMHFHADAAWDFEALLRLMDQLGVVLAGNGGKGADTIAMQFAARSPERFFAFARIERVHAANLAEGSRSWTLQSPATLEALNALERGLTAGCWRGIGELFVNTLSSHRSQQLRAPADSPLMRRLWGMSARYGVSLSVHMDADAVSIGEMERLLESDRAGTWIWAHSGWFAEPSLLRGLLEEHSNLYLELSFRDSVRSFTPIDMSGRLKPEWRALIEDMPERFVLGTDVLVATSTAYAELVTLWRGILPQLSAQTAVKLAHENAARLLAPKAQRPAAPPEICLAML